MYEPIRKNQINIHSTGYVQGVGLRYKAKNTHSGHLEPDRIRRFRTNDGSVTPAVEGRRDTIENMLENAFITTLYRI